jgi:hypothetical protein
VSELFTSLPRHLYCYVERRFIARPRVQPVADESSCVPCSWFGLTSIPGRAWGLSVLLECGAIYSHLPPHAIYFAVPGVDTSNRPWKLTQAQLWDCFGTRFALHEYEQLAGRDVEAYVSGFEELVDGEYLFTAQHYGDAYAMAPEQAKQYHFCKLSNGRLIAYPANKLVFHDDCFTNVNGLPNWLARQTAIYACEGLDDDATG